MSGNGRKLDTQEALNQDLGIGVSSSGRIGHQSQTPPIGAVPEFAALQVEPDAPTGWVATEGRTQPRGPQAPKRPLPGRAAVSGSPLGIPDPPAAGMAAARRGRTPDMTHTGATALLCVLVAAAQRAGRVFGPIPAAAGGGGLTFNAGGEGVFLFDHDLAALEAGGYIAVRQDDGGDGQVTILHRAVEECAAGHQ